MFTKLTRYALVALSLFVAKQGFAQWDAWYAASKTPHEEVQQIQVRDGVVEPVLISRTAPDQNPKYLLLLFPGHPGIMKLREENGRIVFELLGNFLLRARRHLVDAETATVSIDAPTDEHCCFEDHFRLGEKHAKDIGKVIDALKIRFPESRIYLVGTSNGTVSVASLAARLPDKIDGAILTASATVALGRAPYLSGFDFGQIKVPTLFVHHRDDGCVVCPYTRARDISSKYGFPLITVTGATNPTGDPCQAYSQHGFRGREKETMAAILKWVKSRDVTETIN